MSHRDLHDIVDGCEILRHQADGWKPQSRRESQDKTTYQLVTWTQDDESSEELPMQLSAALVKNGMPYWIMKHYIFKKMVYVLYGNPRTNHQQGF